jgi:deoxyribodipyrimidine photo-lyase
LSLKVFCLKKIGIKNLINIGKFPENSSKKILNELIENKIKDYGTTRDIPSVEGTSKLSPYIKHGQIHVASIWENVVKSNQKELDIENILTNLDGENFLIV